MGGRVIGVCRTVLQLKSLVWVAGKRSCFWIEGEIAVALHVSKEHGERVVCQRDHGAWRLKMLAIPGAAILDTTFSNQNLTKSPSEL